jgi:hypothetical protein
MYHAIEVQGIRLGRRWSAALMSADRPKLRAEPTIGSVQLGSA